MAPSDRGLNFRYKCGQKKEIEKKLLRGHGGREKVDERFYRHFYVKNEGNTFI